MEQLPKIQKKQPKQASISACYNSVYYSEWTVPQNESLFDSQGPEYDECMSMHECTVTKKNQLRGVMFIYNTRICFFSRQSSDSATGKVTVIAIPCGDIVQFQRKNRKIFEQCLDIHLVNNQQISFSCVKERDEAIKCISQLLQWQQRLKPTIDDLSVECIRQHLSEMKRLDPLTQIQSCADTDKYKITEQNKNQNLNALIVELSDDDDDQDICPDDWEQVSPSKEQQKSLVSNQQNKCSEEVNKNTQVKITHQQIFNKCQENLFKLKQTDTISNGFRQQERKERITKIVMGNSEARAKAKWVQVQLEGVSAKEVYMLFFGGNPFQDDKGDSYSNFVDYYNQVFLKEKDMQISEILPEPPALFRGVIDDSDFLLSPDYSMRTCSFTHLVKETFLPSCSCQCQIQERIYWATPNELFIEKEITLQGIPLAQAFSPRLICHIIGDSASNSTLIRCGSYVHYLKDTWFKSKIERTSEIENQKNWIQISSLYIKYSLLWTQKRDNIPLTHIQPSPTIITQLENPSIIELDNDPEDASLENIANATQYFCNIF